MTWHLLPPQNPSHLNCTPLITNAAILLTESTVTSQVLSAPLPPIHDTFLPNPGLDPLYLPSHLPELTCPRHRTGLIQKVRAERGAGRGTQDACPYGVFTHSHSDPGTQFAFEFSFSSWHLAETPWSLPQVQP